MNKFIAIAIFSAATAALSGCGGKEDTEETVESVKKKLIGTWGSYSFEFVDGVIPDFFDTNCDTLKSFGFKPFDSYIDFNFEKAENDTVLIFTKLLNKNLTSIMFTNDPTHDRINTTFEFKTCDVNFTGKLLMTKPDVLGFSHIHKLTNEDLVFLDGTMLVHLYKK